MYNNMYNMYNNFEISPVVFMPNITTNYAITYTNPTTVAHKGHYALLSHNIFRIIKVRISNYAQHIPNSSRHILNSLQIRNSSQHISKSSQHIRPRTPSVCREKGTVTQLLLLPSTPRFVPRVDNYKKALFFPGVWVGAGRKCRPRKLRR